MDLENINMGVEVPVFLFFFAAMLTAPVNTNFVIYRTCYVILGFNETDCAKLGSGSNDSETIALEKKVEPEANVILTTDVMVSHILPAITCLFIGPWSDKNGRKPVLLVSLLGYICIYSVKTILSFIPSASPWFILLESIPTIFCGGFSTFIMISLCNITDTSTRENRGVKMGIFEASCAVGMLLGTLSSSYLFQLANYPAVFLVSTGCVVLAFFYTLLLVKESVLNTAEVQGNSRFFSCRQIVEMVKTTFKNRVDNNRSILLLLMGLLVFYILAINNGGVRFLFLRSVFSWSIEKYTIYTSLRSIVWILGTFVGVYLFHKVLHVSEAVLLILGYAAMATGDMLFAIAKVDWQVYAAAAVQGVGAVISPMTRSLISKIVEAEEVGKVFSLTICLEAIAAIISNALYTFIYNSTIDSYPSGFNWFGTVIYSLETVVVMIIVFLRRNSTDVPYVNIQR